MKKTLNIFVLAVALMVAQACGLKSEKTSEESVESEESVGADAMEATESSAVGEEAVLTVAERRAKVEKERVNVEKQTAERTEKRRIEFEEQAKNSPTYTDSEGNIVYNKAEVDPSFTGGHKAMMQYLNSNIKFPKEAEEKGIEGTVFVDFIVSAKGNVREVKVSDAPGEEVDQSFRDEAIRVVTAMPKWVPGRQHGKAVEVRFSLPIAFQMI